MAMVCEKTGLRRERLYTAFAPGAKPIMKLLSRSREALGVSLIVVV
jgi:DNA-binding phage protein